MQKRTIIDRIEIELQTGNVGVRMLKQIIEDDGVTVLSSDYHRTMIDASGDPAATMSAVNAHLAMMGYPSVKAEDHAVLNSAIGPLASVRAAKSAEKAEKAPK